MQIKGTATIQRLINHRNGPSNHSIEIEVKGKSFLAECSETVNQVQWPMLGLEEGGKF